MKDYIFSLALFQKSVVYIEHTYIYKQTNKLLIYNV